jgi:hypothetical protein
MKMARFYQYGWTKEEDDLLAKVMLAQRSKQENITANFPKAAEVLDRTVASVMNRWYKIRKNYIQPKA